MKLTFIVGAGGTGSYFIDEIVNYYNVRGEEHRVIVVDGDRVEEKNLVRQGFLRKDLGVGKAECLVNRYKNIAREGLKLEYYDEFIKGVQDLVRLIGDGSYSSITLVSCVDNNMARLRLTFGVYALRDVYGCDVHFIDSGNEEWHGQTITTSLKKSGETYLEGLYDAVEDFGLSKVQEFKLKESKGKHIYASIFTKNNDWKNNLTKGDHELSCDDITESNPQNIGTNMMASKCLLMTVGMVQSGKFKGGEYVFDARTSSIGRNYDGVSVEEGYEERLKELLEYIQTEDGYKEVFEGESVLSTISEEVVETVVEEKEENGLGIVDEMLNLLELEEELGEEFSEEFEKEFEEVLELDLDFLLEDDEESDLEDVLGIDFGKEFVEDEDELKIEDILDDII